MTINKTIRQKEQRLVRKWGEKNRKEILDLFNNQCNQCKSKEELTIHHNQYKIGFDFVEVLCNKCHRRFHRLETKKRLLTLFLEDISKFKGTIEEYRLNLRNRISQIPVELIKGIKVDGLSSNE